MFALLFLGCTASSPEGRPAVVIPLPQLAWLAGHWRGEQAEELWMPPRAGSMVGSGRVVQGESTVFHEYLRIEQRADGAVRYWAAPEGGQATPFDLVEAGVAHVVFENPAHDFPQRIAYEVTGDALTARVSRLDDEGEAIAMTRVR